MRNKIIALLILSTLSFAGCTDQLDSDGVSRITHYALITLKGDQWNRVSQGVAWTDPGAVATEDDKEIEIKVGGDAVDTSTPGVYVITYTATNKDGFSKIEYRYVGVISPEVEEIDLAGKYKRNAGAGGVSTVTKIDNNFYSSDNVGGVAEPGASTTVYFYHFADGKLGVPYQLVAGSPFYCTDATVDVGVSYSWVVINGGYGTALRTFEKQ